MPQTDTSITTAVVGAMDEEIAVLRQEMTLTNESRAFGKIFYEGKLNGVSFVMTKSGVGKVSSAISVCLLKSLYDVDSLIFTGIAGAVNPALNVGDVVISSKLFQHDVDSRPNFPVYEVPFLKKAIFCADQHLIEKAYASTQKWLSETRPRNKSALADFNITKPKCIKGVFATGDQFITCPTKISAISETLLNTYNLSLDCIEMEGAAVAQSCHELQLPFVVIRTISDSPLSMSLEGYHKFKRLVAGYYTNNIIKMLFSSMSS